MFVTKIGYAKGTEKMMVSVRLDSDDEKITIKNLEKGVTLYFKELYLQNIEITLTDFQEKVKIKECGANFIACEVQLHKDTISAISSLMKKCDVIF